jgi:ArsR family transcriptional regulator, arsenate/arsenite/antimonite-responsive transcriptional repressor
MKVDLDWTEPGRQLRAISDPLRWRILEFLGSEELCVCHLVGLLDAPQSLVSHHLRVLRDAGVVEAERFRYWTYYRLRTDVLDALGRRLTELSAGAPVPGTARRPCC